MDEYDHLCLHVCKILDGNFSRQTTPCDTLLHVVRRAYDTPESSTTNLQTDGNEVVSKDVPIYVTSVWHVLTILNPSPLRLNCVPLHLSTFYV